MAADKITILTTIGPLLTKVWRADGTIKGHDQAKQHTVESFQLENIFDLACVLEQHQASVRSCAIRGEYVGHARAAEVPDPEGERKGEFVLRRVPYFDDIPHHWVMFDVDRYTPVFYDPVLEPEDAIREWIKFSLPPEFHEISFVWQLSSSAGHPSKPGELRCHVWFWMVRPMTSPEARAYITVARIPVDRAPMQVVQAHYFVAPVMEDGVVDPVPRRSGLVEGIFGDEVDVRIDAGALAAATAEVVRKAASDTAAGVDPRQKKGVIGAFCRAFSVEDVLMADWFNSAFERVTSRRYTWLDGNGAAEGAYITDDGFKLVNTHDSAPCDTIGKGLNAYDLVRVYNFGHLDEAVPEDDRWSWDDNLAALPSDQAMRAWARTLPEVQEELEVGDDASNPFAVADVEPEVAETPAPAVSGDAPAAASEAPSQDMRGLKMGRLLVQRLEAMGVNEDEIGRLVDGKVLRAAWSSSFFNSAQSRLYFLNQDGALVNFLQPRWQKAIRSTFGDMLVPDVLKEVAGRLATAASVPAADARKELLKAAWSVFEHHMTLYRQCSELAFEVDMFASRSRVMVAEDNKATVVYAHKPFAVQGSDLPPDVEDAIVAEYRAFFPFFDRLLRQMLAARFASDRRKAFLWMRCQASWGKGFLFEGVLGRDGLRLFCELSVKDIERAFEGSPVGINIHELIRAWGLWIDEFKSVKGEIKMLNNKFMLAPKGQMRVSMPVYLKGFTSAEGVGSLVGSEGVEAQFAERFSLYEATGSVESLPLFNKHGKAAYRAVLAKFAANVLTLGVEEMRALGQHEATRRADVLLSEFHAEFGIANTYGRLQDNLGSMADELRELIMDWGRMKAGMPSRPGLSELKRDLRDELSQSVSWFIGGRKSADAQAAPTTMVAVKRLHSLVQTWINATYSRAELAMMSHKAGEIIELLAGPDRSAKVRYYVCEDSSSKPVEASVKGGMVLEILSPAEHAARGVGFEAHEVDKVTPIRRNV